MGCNICKYNNELIIEEEFKYPNNGNNSQKDNAMIPSTTDNKLDSKANISSPNIIMKRDELLNNFKNNSFLNNKNGIEENNNNIIDIEKNNNIYKSISKSISKSNINNNKEIENKAEESNISNILSSNKCDYNTRVIDLINQIRLFPEKYASVILKNMQYISKEIRIEANDETGQNEEKQEIFFQKKVKVKLYKGEKAFTNAANYIKNIEPMGVLMSKDDIKLILPETEQEMNDNSFVKNQLIEIRKKYNISAFFKDNVKNPEIGILLMIVGDSKKAENKKRNAILNPDYKYISVNSKFIGDSFIAYYTFSK